MSELTKCNYCTLRAIRAVAEKKGKTVTVRGGNVYVHDEGEEIDTKRHWRAWLMEITTYCCC